MSFYSRDSRDNEEYGGEDMPAMIDENGNVTIYPKVLRRINILPVEHPDAYSESNVAVDDVVINYTQDGDTENPDDTQQLKVRTVNNGMARYIVFETERWAISNVDELIAVLEDFKKRAGL